MSSLPHTLVEEKKLQVLLAGLKELGAKKISRLSEHYRVVPRFLASPLGKADDESSDDETPEEAKARSKHSHELGRGGFAKVVRAVAVDSSSSSSSSDSSSPGSSQREISSPTTTTTSSSPLSTTSSASSSKTPKRAVKVIRFSRVAGPSNTILSLQHLFAEIACLQTLDHPNLSRIVPGGLFYNHKKIFLVLELIAAPTPDPATRLCHMFLRRRPSQMRMFDSIFDQWKADAKASGEDVDVENDEQFNAYLDRHRAFEKLAKTWDIDLTLQCVEMPSSGSLLDLICAYGRGLPDGYTSIIMRDVLKAIEYLHNHCISHRDLKCENVAFIINRKAHLKRNEEGKITGCIIFEHVKGIVLDLGLCKLAALAKMPEPDPETGFRKHPPPPNPTQIDAFLKSVTEPDREKLREKQKRDEMEDEEKEDEERSKQAEEIQKRHLERIEDARQLLKTEIDIAAQQKKQQQEQQQQGGGGGTTTTGKNNNNNNDKNGGETRSEKQAKEELAAAAQQVLPSSDVATLSHMKEEQQKRQEEEQQQQQQQQRPAGSATVEKIPAPTTTTTTTTTENNKTEVAKTAEQEEQQQGGMNHHHDDENDFSQDKLELLESPQKRHSKEKEQKEERKEEEQAGVEGGGGEDVVNNNENEKNKEKLNLATASSEEGGGEEEKQKQKQQQQTAAEEPFSLSCTPGTGTAPFLCLEAILGLFDTGMGRLRWVTTSTTLYSLDMWSAGVIAAACVTASLLFNPPKGYREVSRETRFSQIVSLIKAFCELSDEEKKKQHFNSLRISDIAFKFCIRLLQQNAQDRPTAHSALADTFVAHSSSIVVNELQVPMTRPPTVRLLRRAQDYQRPPDATAAAAGSVIGDVASPLYQPGEEEELESKERREKRKQQKEKEEKGNDENKKKQKKKLGEDSNNSVEPPNSEEEEQEEGHGGSSHSPPPPPPRNVGHTLASALQYASVTAAASSSSAAAIDQLYSATAILPTEGNDGGEKQQGGGGMPFGNQTREEIKQSFNELARLLRQKEGNDRDNDDVDVDDSKGKDDASSSSSSSTGGDGGQEENDGKEKEGEK